MRRRRRLAATALLLAGAAVAVIVLLGSGSQQPPSDGGKLGPGRTTSVVTRRTLTESSSVEGTLGYGAEVDLYDRLAGTFTWLPAVGTVVGRGGTLWKIDDRPVALMYGPVPAYRTLAAGVGDGPDVAELNRNLIDLGLDPDGEIDEDAHFGAATTAAVERWQEAEHLPVTGAVELGRIVFAPGARRITALEVAVGQDPPALAPAEEAAAGEPAAAERTAEEEKAAEGAEAKRQREAEEKEAREEEEEEEKEAEAKERPAATSHPKKPAAEEPEAEKPAAQEPAAEEPTTPESSGSGDEDQGTSPESAAAEVALATTSTRQIVQLKLNAAEQGLARVGRSAPVTLPGGDVVEGRVTAVGTVAAAEEGGGPEGGGGGGEATISVTVALDHPVAHLDQAPVSVALVEQVRRHVLAVSATALFATAGGRYAVAALEGGRRVELAVRPGMFADGWVQVEGRGIHPGLRVIEPGE